MPPACLLLTSSHHQLREQHKRGKRRRDRLQRLPQPCHVIMQMTLREAAKP